MTILQRRHVHHLKLIVLHSLSFSVCSDKDSRECTPVSPNAHFFGRSPAASSSNGGINRLTVNSSSGSDEGPVPPGQESLNQEAVDRDELIAKEKTIDAYVNFKRYPVNGVVVVGRAVADVESEEGGLDGSFCVVDGTDCLK